MFRKAIQAKVEATRSGFKPKGNLMISATNDDETAGKFGLKYVVEEGITNAGWPMPDFHFLLEPSNWNVNVAFKGRVWIKITVKGKSAHGGSPEKGINAITNMMELVRRILAIKQNSHPLTPSDSINVGTIQGGEKTNIVPDTCTATFDYRFVGPSSGDQAVQRFRDVVAEMEKEDPEFMVTGFEVFENRDPVEAFLRRIRWFFWLRRSGTYPAAQVSRLEPSPRATPIGRCGRDSPPP